MIAFTPAVSLDASKYNSVLSTSIAVSIRIRSVSSKVSRGPMKLNTGESLTGCTVNANVFESENSPSVTSAVICTEPLKSGAGVIANWFPSTNTETFSLSLEAENVKSGLSLSTSVADRFIINVVSSLVT